MLKKIFLKNFKSISTEHSIEIKDFSIFCGANSSGKSSLIQALLMLSQTFSSRYDFDEVVLNGHLTRLGAFGDIKNHNDLDKTISIEFSIETNKIKRDGRLSNVECKVIFGARPGTTYSTDDDYHPVVLGIEIEVNEMGANEVKNQYMKISRGGLIQSDKRINEARVGSLFEINILESPEVENIIRDYPDAKILGCESTAFIPYVLNIKYNHTKKIAPQIVALAIGKSSISSNSNYDNSPLIDLIIPIQFFNALNSLIEIERDEYLKSDMPKEFKDVLEKAAAESHSSTAILWRQIISSAYPLSKDKLDLSVFSVRKISIKDWLIFLKNLEESVRKALTGLMDKCRADLQEAWISGVSADYKITSLPLQSFHLISNYLSSYFSRSVKYLGPLRNEPQAVYASVGLSDPKNVGLKGEFTAAVLHINRNKTINYPSPKIDGADKFSFVERTQKLDIACKEWLSYLGVISDYQTKDRGKLGYEINVKVDESDRWQDLTHVGVGVSQVLPIVLMFLLSESSDMLIFEQPELHLHPKIQSRLCDFFIAMSSFGRQCLIETHSEYLINRLRLRIVQSRNTTLEENSSIFFVTKNNGKSKFDYVKVNKFGSISDWPKDFFDQTDREVENILIEATKKIRFEKGNVK